MNAHIAGASRLDVRWTTSSYSGGNNNCVQAAALADSRAAVRDSKVPDGPALVFGAAPWAAFLDGLRAQDRPARR